MSLEVPLERLFHRISSDIWVPAADNQDPMLFRDGIFKIEPLCGRLWCGPNTNSHRSTVVLEGNRRRLGLVARPRTQVTCACCFLPKAPGPSSLAFGSPPGRPGLLRHGLPVGRRAGGPRTAGAEGPGHRAQGHLLV